jgi:TolB-like protein
LEDSRTGIRKFWGELRRRRVVKTTVAYAVVAWVIVEASSTIFPALLLPDWTVTLVVVSALVALPVVVVLAWIFDIERKPATDPSILVSRISPPESPEPVAMPPSLESAQASVAVLRFDNPRDDPDGAFLAQGISTELQHTLSRVNRLRVAARVSSFACSGSGRDVRDIGAALNVDFVIAGSVMTLEDNVHLVVELDDAANGVQVWTKSYDGSRNELLRVLKSVAEDVAGAFGGVQLAAEIRQAIIRPTESWNAWHKVQRARAYLLNFSPAAIEDAVETLKSAVRLDPGYAVAHAALASVLGERVINGLSEEPDRDGECALRAAELAAESAPNDPFVLKLSGVASAYFGQLADARRLLRRAVHLAPFDFGAWGYLGWPLAATGDPADVDELHRIMQRMLESSPSHPGAPYWLLHRSFGSSCIADNEQAVQYAAASIEQNPRFPFAWMQYANALGAIGETGQARDAIRRSKALAPGLSVSGYEAITSTLCGNRQVLEHRTAGIAAANAVDDELAG